MSPLSLSWSSQLRCCKSKSTLLPSSSSAKSGQLQFDLATFPPAWDFSSSHCCSSRQAYCAELLIQGVLFTVYDIRVGIQQFFFCKSDTAAVKLNKSKRHYKANYPYPCPRVPLSYTRSCFFSSNTHVHLRRAVNQPIHLIRSIGSKKNMKMCSWTRVWNMCCKI